MFCLCFLQKLSLYAIEIPILYVFSLIVLGATVLVFSLRCYVPKKFYSIISNFSFLDICTKIAFPTSRKTPSPGFCLSKFCK